MYCQNCGNQIEDNAEICTKCGVRVRQEQTLVQNSDRRDPGIASFLSMIIPGGGQVYCGRLNRGVAIFIGTIVLIFILVGIIVWIWNIYDANKIAKEVNVQ